MDGNRWYTQRLRPPRCSEGLTEFSCAQRSTSSWNRLRELLFGFYGTAMVPCAILGVISFVPSATGSPKPLTCAAPQHNWVAIPPSGLEVFTPDQYSRLRSTWPVLTRAIRLTLERDRSRTSWRDSILVDLSQTLCPPRQFG